MATPHLNEYRSREPPGAAPSQAGHAAHPDAWIRGAGLVSRVAAIGVAFVLTGCLVTTTRVDAEKTGIFQKAVRAGFNVNGGERAAAEARSGHTIEIGYQGVQVSASQSLATGQSPVILNGTTFAGPNQLRNDFDFSHLDIAWRMREFSGRPFGLEMVGGLALTSVGLAITSPTQHATQNFSTAGLQLGLGAIWRMSPSSSLHARATYYFSRDTGVNSLTKYEFYYANALYKNVSLQAGYSDWEMDGSGGAGTSDFRLHFAGPVVVLHWNFNLGD